MVSENWKIFLATTIVAIILLLITIFWPTISDYVWGKHPDTQIFLYGMEHSYTLDELKEIAPIRSKIEIIPIKFPEGVSSLNNEEVPLKFFKWNYSPNEKLYTIAAHNKGEGIARNIKVDIDFTPHIIKSLKIGNEKRIELIRGGENGTRAIFKIDELLPDEIQDVELLVEGKQIKSFEAWSESQGEIKNIYIFDLRIEPDINFT